MSVIYLLIIVSLFVAVGFLMAFLWAVKSGQYEDKYTPSIRMLIDDKDKATPNSKLKNMNKKR
jgi:cbb3-type cytochrome oxidase maturation protein